MLVNEKCSCNFLGTSSAPVPAQRGGFDAKRPNITMSADDDLNASDNFNAALAPEETKLKPPSLYRVILLNDDYTPMEFVVEILCSFFSMNAESATQVMLKVHTEGKGVCGVFPKDIAETKAVLVNDHSRAAEHPLLCDIEIDT